MRSNADAGAGPEIDEYLTAAEFCRDLASVRDIDDDHASAPMGVTRSPYFHIGFLGKSY